MSKRKKINKFKVSIVIIIVAMLLMTVTGFGRFVYNTAKDRYLSSKNFYFTSNLLTIENDTYQYTNWDGNGIYEIEIDLFSQKNELEQYTENLNYSVLLGYNDTDILCALDPSDFKESTGTTVTDIYSDAGIIVSTTHKDTLKLYVKPNIDEVTGKEKVLDVDDTYEIVVKAYTTSPYRKTLTGTFNLKIADISYKIEENLHNSDVMLNISNNYDYDSDVTINFDNTLVHLDLNDSVFIENKSRIENDETNGYVKAITFTMPAESSRDIRFYKTSDSNPEISPTDDSVFIIDRIKKE